MNWQAVTFVTIGTGYEREVLRLKASCDACGVPLRIFRFQPLGSWRANLNFKSQSILDAMAGYPEKDIVFIDADAVVRSYPRLFDVLSEARKHDIAAHFFMQSRVERGELLSGTLWFQNNPTAQTLVQAWHAHGEANPNVRHQRCLQAVLARYGSNIRIYRLPLEYTCIFDHPARRGVVPVIEHFQASRKYRRILSPKKVTPKPTGGPFQLATGGAR